MLKADQYRYRDRRNRKRDFRRLWITRINAAARQNGMSYSQFMHGLKLAGVELDRKILADIAVRDAETFRRFAERAREALAAGWPSRAPADTNHPGAASAGRRPFSFPDDDHLPPQRHSSRRSASSRAGASASDRPVRGRGRGPARRRRRGRLGAGRALRAPAAACRRRGGAGAAGAGLGARAPARACSAVYEERWAARRPGRCASACTASTTPATSARCCARALAFGAASRRARPRHAPTRSAPKAVRASMGALFAVPVARARSVGELPGDDGRARRARAASRSPRLAPDGAVTLVVGAERDGPADATSLAACDRVAQIPIAHRVAERRDGGDGRAVRARD